MDNETPEVARPDTMAELEAELTRLGIQSRRVPGEAGDELVMIIDGISVAAGIEICDRIRDFRLMEAELPEWNSPDQPDSRPRIATLVVEGAAHSRLLDMVGGLGLAGGAIVGRNILVVDDLPSRLDPEELIVAVESKEREPRRSGRHPFDDRSHITSMVRPYKARHRRKR